MTDKNIPVLDCNNRFLSYTNPAKARILIKDGKGTVFSKNPFMIKLKGEIGEDDMAIKRQTTSLITNFTKYFSEPKEVFVQNMGATQISLTFRGYGMSGDVHVLIPRTKKPYNLTQDVPFELIAASNDFRKLVNRRNPPVLRLLEEDEFIEFYEKIAERNGTSFEEELQAAMDLKDNLKKTLPSESAQRTYEAKLEEKTEKLEEKPEELHPTIIGLCARADKDMGSMRLTADEFLDELDVLLPELTDDDLEFIMTKGVYKKVKKFASDLFDERHQSSEDEE